ncbi:MAG TPA: hypothetical protein VHU80_21315 [Polyangiaceae bacterium]|nr:hypothetical protein [Polyangiaceae bacterium]
MLLSLSRALAFVCVSSLLAACGGSEPEPKEPSSTEAPASTDEKPAKSEDANKPAEAASSDDKKDDTAKKDDAPAADAKSSKSLKDVLTTPGALFVFSFANSDVHQAADDKCTKSAKDDPKKKADCMTKASAKLEGDAFQFQEQGDNKGVWITMLRKGDKLTTKHKVDVEFGKETDKSITVTPKAGKEVVIQVPSEGQIVIDDPKLGKMVYELKLGLLGDQQR